MARTNRAAAAEAAALTVTPEEIELTIEAFDAGLDEVERVYH